MVVRAELERPYVVAFHDRGRGRALTAKSLDQGVDFITAEFAGRCHVSTSVPISAPPARTLFPLPLLQHEGSEMNFLDAAEILQQLELHVDGVTQRA